jgi:hypothetical protein
LSFLNGTKTLNNYCNTIISLTKYNSWILIRTKISI